MTLKQLSYYLSNISDFIGNYGLMTHLRSSFSSRKMRLVRINEFSYLGFLDTQEKITLIGWMKQYLLRQQR